MRENNPLYIELFSTNPTKGDRKKLEIIEAATRVMAQVGVQNTTLDAVGKELGIRRSHVVYYFQEIEEVVEAGVKLAVATGQSMVVKLIEKAKSPRRQLELYIRGTFEWVERYPEQLSLVYFLYYQGTHDPVWKKLNTAFKEAGRGRVAAMIESGWKGKPLSREQLKELSRRAHNILVVNVLEQCTTRSSLSLKKLCSATLDQVLALLGKNFS